jgi:hypothetical protein
MVDTGRLDLQRTVGIILPAADVKKNRQEF